MTASSIEPPAGHSTGSLRSLIRRGATWSAIDVGISRFSNFAVGLIVARLLVPADFGVFAVALVVHTIVINISELGISAALVRDDDDTVARSAPTVVTLAFLSSLLLGVLMALSAPELARLLGAPQASSVIRLMSVTLPLAGISAVPSALLRRDFRTDKMFVADMANLVVTIAAVIPLALAGWGAMALGWSWVLSQVATSAVLVAFMPGRCRPGFDRSQVKRLLVFGVPLAAANLLTFAVQNVDYVVVGRVLGSVSLGLYMLAFNISGWPMNLFSSVVRTVSLPAFARIRHDRERLPLRFGKAVHTVALFTFPACLFLAALARPLITGLYGSRWAAASDALIGLALLGALRTVIEPFADFLVALGRTRAVLLAQVPWLAGLTIGLVVGVRAAGIGGAGAAHAIVATCVVLPVYTILLRREGVSPSIVIRSLVPPFAWSMLAAAVAWVVASPFGNPWIAALAGGSAGLLVYVAANLSAIRRTIVELFGKRHDSPTDKRAIADDGAAILPSLAVEEMVQAS